MEEGGWRIEDGLRIEEDPPSIVHPPSSSSPLAVALDGGR
jgi:hypothetical protein